MKRRFVVFAIAMAALFALLPGGLASAQNPAYNTPFVTSITYQNVGTGSANITLNFYDENSGTAIPITRPSLAQNAGTSVYVGSLNDVPTGFRGSAVLSSSQPVVATLVQVPQSTTVANRPLSNGFTGAQGSANFLIASTLKNKFNATTIFSVQNVSASNVNLTVRFFNADNPAAAPIQVTHNGLPAGAAKYYDLGVMNELPSGFNGSATIQATGGNIIASAMELSTNGTAASAFEGVSGGATQLYMPSALCNAFGGQNTAYAVQNTSQSQTANVTVSYSNGNTASANLAPGSKKSFIGCDVNPANFSGSATIASTNGVAIAAIGKVYGLGLSTAFVGETAGSDKLALPYVRWSESRFNTNQRDRQRTYIAIQNVGGSSIASGQVQVQYVDKNGTVVGTHTINQAIAPGAKVNSNPSNIGAPGNEFGYYTDGTFGGSVILVGPNGSQLVAVARVASFPASGFVGEDYNGIAID